MCSKVNHYTRYNMLCKSLQTHKKKVGVNTLQGETGPFQKANSALKAFQYLCWSKTVLIATGNTTVVAYINKKAGMRSGPLCALLWGILTWCTRRQVTLKVRHIPGPLNVNIKMEWSLYPEVFQAICTRWHHRQVDLFATRFNNKLPQFARYHTPNLGKWMPSFCPGRN